MTSFLKSQLRLLFVRRGAFRDVNLRGERKKERREVNFPDRRRRVLGRSQEEKSSFKKIVSWAREVGGGNDCHLRQGKVRSLPHPAAEWYTVRASKKTDAVSIF